MDVDRVVSAETALKMHDEYNGVFTGIGCFKATFPLWVKDNTKPYQVPLKCIAYVLQELFKKELEMFPQHQILVPLGLDKTAKWCNSLIIAPKSNGTVH